MVVINSKKIKLVELNRDETYDPLSQANKVMMLPNGLFEFSDIPDITCVCGHKFIQHLDGASVCMIKDQICLCLEFRESSPKLNEVDKTTTTKNKLPKKKEIEEVPDAFLGLKGYYII